MPLTPSTSSPRQWAAPGVAGERESPTPSQLDILAERNERFATPSPLRRAASVLAISAAVLLLVAVLWWVAQRGDPDSPGTAPNANAASTATAAIAPAVAPDAAASRPIATSTGASEGPATDARPAAVTVPAAASSPLPAQAQASPPALTPAERARKAQARRDADTRAKASPVPTQGQQRDTDKARDLTAATPATAESRSGAGPAAPGAETASRPRTEAVAAGVREFCAARGNIVSQLFCHSRECRKPERAMDATCVRLKEIEEAQRRVDAQ